MYKRVEKRYERNNQRPYRFEETREYQLAEQWFRERQETVQKPVTVKCTKCSINTDKPVSMSCCKSVFCNRCFVDRAELYNRCGSCNDVIDRSKYELYDGCDLTIPTYDKFCYLDEPKILPIVLEPIEPFEEDYVGQLAQQDIINMNYIMLLNAMYYLKNCVY
jgi:hypothetical protein